VIIDIKKNVKSVKSFMMPMLTRLVVAILQVISVFLIINNSTTKDLSDFYLFQTIASLIGIIIISPIEWNISLKIINNEMVYRNISIQLSLLLIIFILSTMYSRNNEFLLAIMFSASLVFFNIIRIIVNFAENYRLLYALLIGEITLRLILMMVAIEKNMTDFKIYMYIYGVAYITTSMVVYLLYINNNYNKIEFIKDNHKRKNTNKKWKETVLISVMAGLNSLYLSFPKIVMGYYGMHSMLAIYGAIQSIISGAVGLISSIIGMKMAPKILKTPELFLGIIRKVFILMLLITVSIYFLFPVYKTYLPQLISESRNLLTGAFVTEFYIVYLMLSSKYFQIKEKMTDIYKIHTYLIILSVVIFSLVIYFNAIEMLYVIGAMTTISVLMYILHRTSIYEN
jgi:hypothetical protein